MEMFQFCCCVSVSHGGGDKLSYTSTCWYCNCHRSMYLNKYFSEYNTEKGSEYDYILTKTVYVVHIANHLTLNYFSYLFSFGR